MRKSERCDEVPFNKTKLSNHSKKQRQNVHKRQVKNKNPFERKFQNEK